MNKNNKNTQENYCIVKNVFLDLSLHWSTFGEKILVVETWVLKGGSTDWDIYNKGTAPEAQETLARRGRKIIRARGLALLLWSQYIPDTVGMLLP